MLQGAVITEVKDVVLDIKNRQVTKKAKLENKVQDLHEKCVRVAQV